MHRVDRVSLIVLAASAAGVPLSSEAFARPCTYVLGSYQNGFMPDFDQRRTPGPLVFDGQQFINMPPGLPGNGAAYCSPSSHTNVMGYLSKHGFPSLMPGGPIPSSWGAQSQYNRVNSRIFDMGQFMVTHPSDGTTCCGFSGMVDYLDAYQPGKFTVTEQFSNDFYAPSANDMAFCVIAGGFLNAMVGWFENTGPNEWDKSGGHVVTMTELKGWCVGAREIGIRDPANDSANQQTQSTFATNRYTLTQFPGFFNTDGDGGGITVHYQRTYERMQGYDTSDGRIGLINGYRVILPKAGVTIKPLPQNGFDIVNPIRPTHTDVPPVIGLPLTTPGSVNDFAVDPSQRYIYYTVKGTASPDPRVFRVDRHTGESDPIYQGQEPTAVECGRHRSFFVIDRTNLSRIDPDAPAPTRGAASAALPAPVDAMVFDDATDRLICLSRTANQVFIFDGTDLSVPPRIESLPSGIALGSGKVYMATAQGGTPGQFFVRGGGTPSGYRLFVGGLSVSLIETITNSLFVGAEGLDVDATQTREHILLARQNQIMVFEKNSMNQWVPTQNSDFAGLAASGGIKLTRSRTNLTPDMIGPRAVDVLPGTSSPPQWDCPGDADEDGDADFADVILILSQWDTTPESAVDADSSGAVGFSDVLVVLRNWGPCE